MAFQVIARDAKALRQAKAAYKQSPHGRLTLIVHKRMQDGYSLISTHGGLILLAIPFQLILVILPLSVVMFTPDGLMRPNRKTRICIGSLSYSAHRFPAYFPFILSTVYFIGCIHSQMVDIDDKTLVDGTSIGTLATWTHGKPCGPFLDG